MADLSLSEYLKTQPFSSIGSWNVSTVANIHKTFHPEETANNEAGALSENEQIYAKMLDFVDYYYEYKWNCFSSPTTGFNRDIEGCFKYAMTEFEKIANSSDDAETKALKRAALEASLKSYADSYAQILVSKERQVIRVAPYQGNTKSALAEARVFLQNQQDALYASMQKLTLNFLDYIKNAESFDAEKMLDYVNKDAKNDRNINNLSIRELVGFSEYTKLTANNDIKQTQQLFEDYFGNVSKATPEELAERDLLDKRWSETPFSSGITLIDIRV